MLAKQIPNPADDIYLDAIAELLNVGVGSSVSALSEMVDAEVALSVPRVIFLTREQAITEVTHHSTETVASVQQHFQGPFWGDAALLFPDDKSLALVPAVLGQPTSTEVCVEMQEEVVVEVGNIILNACLASLADIFNHSLDISIPEFHSGTVTEFFQLRRLHHKEDETILLLNMEFSINEKAIHGYVIFMMDILSVDAFKAHIDEYLGM